MNIAYEYNNSIYLNITNKCPTLCVFCIKKKWNMDYRGYNLKLDKEPEFDEIKKDIEKYFSKKNDYKEIVFCGYGEPTMRFEMIKDIASGIRNGKFNDVKTDIKIRINTNGLGNLINKRDITVEMKNLVDVLYISLNTTDPKQWLEIMRPFNDYKEKGFESVIDFIKKAKQSVRDVVITAVDLDGINIKLVEDFASDLDVKFLLRPLL